MTRNPYGPDELDRDDPELDAIAERLERYAAEHGGEPPPDLVSRIQSAIDEEPNASAGWWTGLAAASRSWRGPARALAGAAVVVAAVLGAMAVGELAERARRDDVGASPVPTPVVTPSPTPSSSPTPTPTPSLSPSPTSSPSATETPTPSASASASDDDEFETPEPSDDDNSGSGGGDDSGPGGGDDDSGPGGG